MRNTKNAHNKKISRAIKLVVSSLDSHLDWTHRTYTKGEPKNHHVKAVKEYAELISILSSLYR
jgi:hypothetical protein